MTSWLSAALSLAAAHAAPVASLRVDANGATFVVAVREYRSAGYQIEVDCVAKCSRRFSYRESVSDSPLGLFTRDRDDLVFSTWSAGSAYRVRVWRVSASGIGKIAELSSRGMPDFLSGRSGRPSIRTYEGDSGTGPMHSVLWTYRDGRFVRGERNVR